MCHAIPYPGNLYYALTHSPAPLTKDDAYTLSWEAATERLEAAGSIPVKEAEMMANALSSRDAGIEVRKPVNVLLLLNLICVAQVYLYLDIAPPVDRR